MTFLEKHGGYRYCGICNRHDSTRRRALRSEGVTKNGGCVLDVSAIREVARPARDRESRFVLSLGGGRTPMGVRATIRIRPANRPRRASPWVAGRRSWPVLPNPEEPPQPGKRVQRAAPKQGGARRQAGPDAPGCR